MELVMTRDDFLRLIGTSLEKALPSEHYSQDEIDYFIENVATTATGMTVAAFGSFWCGDAGCPIEESVGVLHYPCYKQQFIHYYDAVLRAMTEATSGIIRVVDP